MLDFKANYKNDYKYKAEKCKCDACGKETNAWSTVSSGRAGIWRKWRIKFQTFKKLSKFG